MDHHVVIWALAVISAAGLLASSSALWLKEIRRIGGIVGWPVLMAWIAAVVSVPGILIGHTLATLG